MEIINYYYIEEQIELDDKIKTILLSLGLGVGELK